MKKNITHEELLVHIAQDYYYNHLSISEVARKYQTSRYLITKYLQRALKNNVVTIQIHSPYARNFQLETKFKYLFKIPHIAILRTNNETNSTETNIVEYASQRLQLLIDQSHIIGVTWGNTLHEVIDHFNNELQEDLVFTQFMGENMKYNSQAGTTRMVENAASHFEAKYITLPAPLYIVNDKIRKLLPQEPAFKQVMSTASKMDLIFCGIGTVSSIDSIPTWHKFKKKIFPGVKTDQIAGMLFGRPYDINGNFLLPKKDTVMGITLNQILSTSRRFGVIKSKFKTYSALGALRGKLLTDIVMDEGIAQRILMANSEI